MSLANISKLIRETSNAPGTDVVLQASIDFETSSVTLEVAIKMLGRTTGTFVLSLDAGTLELGFRGKTTANDILVCNISDAVASTNFQLEMTEIGHRNRIAFKYPFHWFSCDRYVDEYYEIDRRYFVRLTMATPTRNRYDPEKNLRLIEKAPRATIWTNKCPQKRLLHNSVN